MNRTSNRILLIVAAFALFLVPVAAIAAAGFDDVADDSVFVADIQWMKDAGVTKGCNPPANTKFCPENNVTREQMSAFMHRLAINKVVDAATAVEADHALEADHATAADTATNADKVDGYDAAGLMSDVLLVHDEGFMALPADSSTEVLSLSLAPGSYLILANGVLNSNSATANKANCVLAAGAVSADTTDFVLYPATGPGDREGWSLMIATTLTTTTNATVTCSTSAGFSGNILGTELAAISLQSASMTPIPASGGGDSEG